MVAGTLSLAQLYRTVPEGSSPQPIIDENPSEMDVRFMKMALKCSEESLDDHTHVSKLMHDHPPSWLWRRGP